MHSLAAFLHLQAQANLLANERMHAAFAALPVEAFDAPRTGFFPSIGQTLNHILVVDRYYTGALHGETDVAGLWDRFLPATDWQGWSQQQRASDERLIAFCAQLTEAGCAAEVAMPRSGGRIQRDALVNVLAHLFNHQVHHRGQVHAMLSSTSAQPPQLDEFLMPSEAHLRVADMARLGWSEAEVYGPMALSKVV